MDPHVNRRGTSNTHMHDYIALTADSPTRLDKSASEVPGEAPRSLPALEHDHDSRQFTLPYC